MHWVDRAVMMGLLAAALAGLLLIRRSIAFKGTEPHCRRCGFDLAGIAINDVKGERARCPECGGGLSRPRAVRLGRRTRRPSLLILGLVLVLLGTSGAIWLVRVPRVDVPGYLPTPVLMALIRREPGTSVITEVVERVKKGRTDADQNAAIAACALARHQDPSRQWTEQWTDLLVALYNKSAIHDEDLYPGLRASLTAKVITRDRVRATGVQAMRAEIDLRRWIPYVTTTLGVTACRAEYHDESGRLVATASEVAPSMTEGWLAIGRMRREWAVQVPDVPTGIYQVTYTVTLGLRTGKIGEDAPMAVSVPVVVQRSIEVVSADTPVVPVTARSDAEYVAQHSLPRVRIEVRQPHGRPPRLRLDTWAERPSIGLSYRVYIKPAGASDDARILLGTMVVHEEPGDCAVGSAVVCEAPLDFDAQWVDVIFEPDPYAAEQNLCIQTVNPVPIRFDGIEMEWHTPRPE